MSVSQLDISTSNVTFANTMSHDVTWEISSGSARKVRTSIVGIAAACDPEMLSPRMPVSKVKMSKSQGKKRHDRIS